MRIADIIGDTNWLSIEFKRRKTTQLGERELNSNILNNNTSSLHIYSLNKNVNEPSNLHKNSLAWAIEIFRNYLGTSSAPVGAAGTGFTTGARLVCVILALITLPVADLWLDR